MHNNQVNIERAVLSSYLQIDFTTDAFKNNRRKLDKDIFVLPFHKRLVEKINNAIDKKEPLQFLMCMIQDKIVGTSYENDLLLIQATIPLSVKCGLNWYIDYLVQNKIEREFGDE